MGGGSTENKTIPGARGLPRALVKDPCGRRRSLAVDAISCVDVASCVDLLGSLCWALCDQREQVRSRGC